MPVRLLTAPDAASRLAACQAWLQALPRGAPALIVGASHEAARELVRRSSVATGGSFGWQSITLAGLAREVALPSLAAEARVPATGLAIQALTARIVAHLAHGDELGRYSPVAGTPGLPRAFARTLREVRLADLAPEALPAELAAAARRLEHELEAFRLADRALVLRRAAEAAERGDPARLFDLPIILLDLDIRTTLEARLLAALVARAPQVLATQPDGEISLLSAALGVTAEPTGSPPAGALGRLQRQLFQPHEPEPGELDETVRLLSAPGEARECVEIARALHAAADRGVPYDRMAVLLHSPGGYRDHLQEALRRADVPTWSAHASLAPDPAGRALLALLATASEGLSARRFAEYLSLGELPAEVALDPEEGEGPEEDELGPAPLRAPRQWERLLVDAAVIGGLDRWRRRLAGLATGLDHEIGVLEPDDPRRETLARQREELDQLTAFALPLLSDLASLPARATWGEWVQQLTALAHRSLRDPTRVLAVLTELRPMAELGPVGLDEVRQVLTPRWTALMLRTRPRRHGRVFVGPIASARGLDFEVVCVPGLAERVFPHKVVEDPLLLDAQRSPLPGYLPINADRAAEQREALRLAIGSSSGSVIISWPRLEVERARPRVPSFYGLEVLRAAEGILPTFEALTRRAEAAGSKRLGWPAPADPAVAIDEAEHDLAVISPVLRRPEADRRGVLHYMMHTNDHLARSLRARARRWWTQGKRFTSADGLVGPRPAAAEALAAHYLGARAYSATALQHFAACPYRFFLYAVHRLTPREQPEPIERLDPRSRGSLIHEVQFQTLSALRDRGDLPVRPHNLAGALALADRHLDALAARYADDLAPAIERVWTDGIEQVRADLREWLLRTSRDEQWTPAFFELAFGLPPGPAFDPASRSEPVQLPGGLTLRGAIDLVERHTDGALRATDHKTGPVRMGSEATVSGGGILQPALYAMALEALFQDQRVVEGRLYHCTGKGEFEQRHVPLDAYTRGIIEQVVKVIRSHLEGSNLPAAPAEGACRSCDYRVVCGPHEERRVAACKPELPELAHLRSLK